MYNLRHMTLKVSPVVGPVNYSGVTNGFYGGACAVCPLCSY